MPLVLGSKRHCMLESRRRPGRLLLGGVNYDRFPPGVPKPKPSKPAKYAKAAKPGKTKPDGPGPAASPLTAMTRQLREKQGSFGPLPQTRPEARQIGRFY
jgi:hypothetical protein